MPTRKSDESRLERVIAKSSHPKYQHPRYREKIEVHGLLAKNQRVDPDLRREKNLQRAEKFQSAIKTIRVRLHQWWETIERMADEEEEWERSEIERLDSL